MAVLDRQAKEAFEASGLSKLSSPEGIITHLFLDQISLHQGGFPRDREFLDRAIVRLREGRKSPNEDSLSSPAKLARKLELATRSVIVSQFFP